jgi:GntR family transcriptional repressor for pyruvate dehydrogenase complex
MAIAYAAKNPLHILIMRNFYDYLFHGIGENLACLYEEPDNIQEILRQHNNHPGIHHVQGSLQGLHRHE